MTKKTEQPTENPEPWKKTAELIGVPVRIVRFSRPYQKGGVDNGRIIDKKEVTVHIMMDDGATKKFSCSDRSLLYNVDYEGAIGMIEVEPFTLSNKLPGKRYFWGEVDKEIAAAFPKLEKKD